MLETGEAVAQPSIIKLVYKSYGHHIAHTRSHNRTVLSLHTFENMKNQEKSDKISQVRM